MEAPNYVTIGGQNGMKPASSRGGIRSVYWDGDLGEVIMTFEIVLLLYTTFIELKVHCHCTIWNHGFPFSYGAHG